MATAAVVLGFGGLGWLLGRAHIGVHVAEDIVEVDVVIEEVVELVVCGRRCGWGTVGCGGR